MSRALPRLMYDPSLNKQPTRIQIVLEYLKDQIISGKLKPGARLPTEAEIGEKLGISRTPVREALKIFEAMGVLAVRRGSGMFVNPDIEPSLAQLLLFKLYLQETTPQKMMEVRRLIARGCAELAAERRTDDDLAAMSKAIEKMKSFAGLDNPPWDDVLEADLEFHRAIHRATGNELTETIANYILDMVAPWIKFSLKRLTPQAALDSHMLEFRMIQNGNAVGARETSVLNPSDFSVMDWRDSLIEMEEEEWKQASDGKA